MRKLGKAVIDTRRGLDEVVSRVTLIERIATLCDAADAISAAPLSDAWAKLVYVEEHLRQLARQANSTRFEDNG